MKRIAAACLTSIMIVILTGANNNPINTRPAAVTLSKKPCYGYTIIEFGKGVDCNGDTIRLVKVPGGQARATAVDPQSIATLAPRGRP